ncbi:MAG TPA: hypothetical protein VKR27_05215 [Acidimicrobiales bacterium]|nr:hypothetical protein [Acidimicrobiales bacterium]
MSGHSNEVARLVVALERLLRKLAGQAVREAHPALACGRAGFHGQRGHRIQTTPLRVGIDYAARRLT